MSVVTRRERLGATVGQYGWNGALGTLRCNDPVEQMTCLSLTNMAWTSPRPPAIALDFLTSAYTALNE